MAGRGIGVLQKRLANKDASRSGTSKSKMNSNGMPCRPSSRVACAMRSRNVLTVKTYTASTARRWGWSDMQRPVWQTKSSRTTDDDDPQHRQKYGSEPFERCRDEVHRPGDSSRDVRELYGAYICSEPVLPNAGCASMLLWRPNLASRCRHRCAIAHVVTDLFNVIERFNFAPERLMLGLAAGPIVIVPAPGHWLGKMRRGNSLRPICQLHIVIALETGQP